MVHEENKDYQVGVLPTQKLVKLFLLLAVKESPGYCRRNRAKKRSDRTRQKRSRSRMQGSLNYKHYDFKSSENGKRIRIYSMRVKKILNSFPEKKERQRVVISFDQAEQVVKEEYLGILRELRKRII